jgi:hypothetical protein
MIEEKKLKVSGRNDLMKAGMLIAQNQ